ncbi:MAG TPA: DNA repair protein RecN [Solirubrobacteraceae bacterium]|jgi:DNA repair protein RecN (Recombination protein N)|nr:DNA repair protein RecN [Solirubrobacteraceae bacterium]
MLHELNVENLLLIERAQLRLAPGLNVLTGETGSGKTVLAHALDLLLGGRARPGIVRPGASEAYVEGVFELSDGLRKELGERLAADAGEIVLARRIDADGRRTRAYLNGRSATVGELRDIGARLVSFYGQHEHRKLTVAAAQLQVLDGRCGPDQVVRLHECAEAYRLCSRLEAELEKLRELAEARGRELDLLEHELAEIDDAAPEEREHERLLAARERLRGLDALCSAAGHGAQGLVAPDSGEDPGAVSLLATAAARLDAVAGVDPELDGLAQRLGAIVVESQDLAGELRDYGERLAGEEGSLEEVEQRLAATERLVRKHGGSIADVLAYAERARARREELEGAQGALAQTEERLAQARAELDRHVVELRHAREQAAPRLAEGVREQLAALAMADAEFEVTLSERAPGPTGGDSVEMLIAPNPGVPAGPLREIASGGELSRVMLAVITASTDGERLAAEDASGRGRLETLVFDEIDAGIGGHTARAVGERLRALGESRQVLCITHLPQIASLGARHFSVVKDTSADPTLATVVQLGEPQVVSELVRMLGARDGDATARRHARDLRKAA